MRALCNREALLTAFGMVSGVVPIRSPKPILQNVKLITDTADASVLMGTDLEVGIRHRVLGVKVERAGTVVLPTVEMGSILRTSTDTELAIESDEERLLIRGVHSEFTLPVEDSNLFPEVPDFAASSYYVIAAADLKKLIRRTVFATDVESTRYALGRCFGRADARVDHDGWYGRTAVGAYVSPRGGRARSTGTTRITGDPGQGTQAHRAQLG